MTAYPALPNQSAERLLALEGDELDAAVAGAAIQKGQGGPLDTRVVDRLVEALEDLRTSLGQLGGKKSKRWDEFEVPAAIIVHRAMLGTGPDVQGDPDFWRWLAVTKLRDVVNWRYVATEGMHAPLANFGIGNNLENLVYRLWLRGDIGYTPGAEDPYELARVGGRDFWRSHVFRQGYGNCRPLVHALLRLQSDNIPGYPRLTDGEVRELAKLLARLRTNVYYEVLSADDARDLVLGEVSAHIRPRGGAGDG